ncbi:YfaP family protein, partial [Desulfolutivibrio sp.]|uniref:YfaP family protein n=1 Tax=Desulfolutivibrio sp. TaxID=2773296 RepID=UPI002F9633FF
PFDSIYKDAESGFDGSGDAQVTITSHTFDQEVNQRTVTVVGKIESGQVLVTKIKLTLNGTTPFEAAVDAQGNFSVPVSLNYGENTIAFTTYGKNSKGFTVETPNNQLTPFKLKLILNKAVILVTLTWNTNNTDLDLYVIDPTGDASWYQHKTTADGGKLDYDDTSGYGPEHWTLLDTNTVRWGQAYRVRVHYYSDHQSGTPTPPTIPSGYTINVLLYEGTANPVTLNYSGVLSSESSSNISPTATGADWATVVDIIPVQPTSGAQPQFIRDPSGTVKLLVPMTEEMLAPKQESPPRP